MSLNELLMNFQDLADDVERHKALEKVLAKQVDAAWEQLPARITSVGNTEESTKKLLKWTICMGMQEVMRMHKPEQAKKWGRVFAQIYASCTPQANEINLMKDIITTVGQGDEDAKKAEATVEVTGST